MKISDALINRALKEMLAWAKNANKLAAKEIPTYVEELLRYEAFHQLGKGLIYLFFPILMLIIDYAYLKFTIVNAGSFQFEKVGLTVIIGGFILAGANAGLIELTAECFKYISKGVKPIIAPRVAAIDLLKQKLNPGNK